MFNQGFTKILDPTDDLLRGKVAIHHDRNIPLDGRKTRKRTCRYSPRSILKQFLEVKFEHKYRRHAKLITDVGVELDQITELGLAARQTRRSPGMQDDRRRDLPTHQVAHAKQIENRFRQPFTIEKSQRR